MSLYTPAPKNRAIKKSRTSPVTREIKMPNEFVKKCLNTARPLQKLVKMCV